MMIEVVRLDYNASPPGQPPFRRCVQVSTRDIVSASTFECGCGRFVRLALKDGTSMVVEDYQPPAGPGLREGTIELERMATEQDFEDLNTWE